MTPQKIGQFQRCWIIHEVALKNLNWETLFAHIIEKYSLLRQWKCKDFLEGWSRKVMIKFSLALFHFVSPTQKEDKEKRVVEEEQGEPFSVVRKS